MKIKIAIADTNETYAKRLFEALSRQNNLSLSVFTDKDKLEKEIAYARYDIILFDYSMYSNDSLFKSAKLAVALYDEDSEVPYNIPGKYKAVKKYQRGTTIYKEVIGLYSEYVSESPFFNHSKHNFKVICFYSPVGGSGKTTVSMACAHSIANKGRNVMYLNFEPAASYGVYLPLKGGKGIGELFAAIGGSGSFSLKLESLMKKTPQGIIYFEKFENLLDIYEITSEDIEKLIRMIGDTEKAEYVVIDMGSDFNDLNRGIMDISDKIVLVERPEKTAKEKISAFCSHEPVKREYADKICSVINFSPDNSCQSAGGFETAGRIPERKSDCEELVSYISRYSLINIDTLLS